MLTNNPNSMVIRPILWNKNKATKATATAALKTLHMVGFIYSKSSSKFQFAGYWIPKLIISMFCS